MAARRDFKITARDPALNGFLVIEQRRTASPPHVQPLHGLLPTGYLPSPCASSLVPGPLSFATHSRYALIVRSWPRSVGV